jgi:hypothetical protein
MAAVVVAAVGQVETPLQGKTVIGQFLPHGRSAHGSAFTEKADSCSLIPFIIPEL